MMGSKRTAKASKLDGSKKVKIPLSLPISLSLINSDKCE